MNTLYLTWRSNQRNKWYPIGKLTNGEHYHFEYTKGALIAKEECGFQPLDQFPSFEREYDSHNLFPLFANRVLSKNRPEYKMFIEQLNIEENKDDPIAILGRSGGLRETDYYELIPAPQADDKGVYHLHFFVRGISHFQESSQKRILSLQTQERLLLIHDFQNEKDGNAMLLRTDDTFKTSERGMHIIGFVPRYLAEDIALIKEKDPELLDIRVEKVNPAPAPTQFRLLCNLTARWPENYKPFSSSMFEQIALIHSG